MSDYIQDPNNSKKQVPGALPDNYYDRTVFASNVSLTKTPNSVYISSASSDGIRFFFGSSASFADLDLNLTGNGTITASNGSKQITGSLGKTSFLTELVAGDKIEITSASVTQISKISSISSSTSMSITTNWSGLVTTGSLLTDGASITRRRSFMSQSYENYGTPSGSVLNIHPLAFSGSNNDKVVFIYKGGLDGSPRPF